MHAARTAVRQRLHGCAARRTMAHRLHHLGDVGDVEDAVVVDVVRIEHARVVRDLPRRQRDLVGHAF